MRTHRSKITIADTPARHWNRSTAATWRASWSRFVRTCESLARDGFDYSVSLKSSEHGGMPYFTVEVEGRAIGQMKIAKARKAHAFHLPSCLTVDQCRRRAAAGVEQIHRDGEHYARALRHDTAEWRVFDLALRAMVGGNGNWDELRDAWDALADPEWYGGREITREIHNGANLNYLLWMLCQQDTPYRGMKCCNPGDYFRHHDINVEAARKWFARDTTIEDSARCAAREYQENAGDLIAAEMEFWAEMESLSGQRCHMKPGIAAEITEYDDAVAA